LSHKIFREIIRERERQGGELESKAAAASSTCCGTSSGLDSLVVVKRTSRASPQVVLRDRGE
jgi:hypothetical protein